MVKENPRLSAVDRSLFVKVARQAFINPFSEERDRLDLELAGTGKGRDQLSIRKAVVEKVSHRVELLVQKNVGVYTRYAESDRATLRQVILFYVFHLYVDFFDHLILDQIKRGDTSLPVEFADDCIERLEEFGFSKREAEQFFAFFYQLRRAYYFINQRLVGRSPSMRAFRMHLWNNVFTWDVGWYEKALWNRMEDYSTLLLGETGSGKGTAALAVGSSGYIPYDRKRKRFIESFVGSFLSINLSQYSEALIESELFGHKKGAFTGAVENHEGVFSLCRPHGAILLDEIGDVPPRLQIKLLQVLQERFFIPVGSHLKQRFHGRVIAATHRDLATLRKEDRFRDDFYYRLCSDILVVPPLRERLKEDPEEFNELVKHVLIRLVGDSGIDLLDRVLSVLQDSVPRNYGWPGNVRELEQAVRRVLLTGQYSVDPSGGDSPAGLELEDQIRKGSMRLKDVCSLYCRRLYEEHGTYERVSRIAGVDRRTVKKYIEESD